MKIRDRVKELRRVRAGDLAPHPHNWRAHPDAQRDALRGVLAEVGYIDALLARELPDGSLQLIDGHLRAETTPDAIVPVLVVELDDAEADKVLLTHDPLASMADTNADELSLLLANVETESEAVQSLLDQVQERSPDAPFERPEVEIPETYQVLIECKDEKDQQSIYEQMRREGYRCRLLTL